MIIITRDLLAFLFEEGGISEESPSRLILDVKGKSQENIALLQNDNLFKRFDGVGSR